MAHEIIVGPWHVNPSDAYEVLYGTPGTEDVRAVARADWNTLSDDEATAVAQLTAAAPDMLAALPTDAFFDLIRAALRPDAGIAYHELEKAAAACRAARAMAEGR